MGEPHDQQPPPDRTPVAHYGLGLEVFRGLAARLRMSRLLARFPERPIWALFMFVNGFVTIALLALVAMVSGTAFIFPSLGPTAFLFFFSPTAAAASPRNTLAGHAVGILCGFGALWLTGLLDEPPSILTGIVHERRVLAAALSLAATGALMILLNVAHPPAGATTLIVSLGLVREPFKLLTIEVAVAVLTLQAIVINRLAGIDYPLWARASKPPQAR